MTGAVNARSKRQQEKWRFESAVANESTDLLLTLGDSDDAEKKTAASTITKVVSWNDAWVSTFGDYAKTATVKLTGTEAVNKIIVSEGRQDGRRRSLDLADRHAQSRLLLSAMRLQAVNLRLLKSCISLRKLFKSTLNNCLHRNLACIIDKNSRGAKLKRAFEELP